MFLFLKRSLPHLLLSLSICLFISSCQTIDLYERVAPIPKHQWAASFKPSFSFEIKDTAAEYQLYVIIRHNDQYRYNNIWLNMKVQRPDATIQKFTLELPLATAEKGWLGSGMDDLFEHRIALTLDPQKVSFKKSGQYTFALEQIMRDDPLEHVLNAGVRIEKKTR